MINNGEPEYCGKLMFFGFCILNYVYADCDETKHEWNSKIPKYIRFFVNFNWYITVTLKSEMRTCSGLLEPKPKW